MNETLSEETQKKLANYLTEYLLEEKNRGNDPLENWTIWNAINAWQGGAHERGF